MRTVLLLSVLSVSLVHSQAAPLRVLTKPDAALSEPLNRVASIRELADGRVIILDANDLKVLVGDFAKSATTQIGRDGAGPAEYRMPSRLIGLGGDSSGVMDPANRRMLVITREAKAGGFLSVIGTEMNSALPPGTPQPSASDASGRLYAQGRFVFGPPGPPLPDSAAIERWNLGSLQRDTVGWMPLWFPPGTEAIPGGMGYKPGEFVPYTSYPQWAVAPDGRVAILRPNPYQVSFVEPSGTKQVSPPIVFRPIPLSEGHRKLWMQEASRPRPVIAMTRDRQTSVSVRSFSPPEPARWPETLPPFLNEAVRFAPDGFLWVQRTTAADAPPLFDLIDRRGVVVEQVQLPSATRLVGFGKGVLYLVRIDADDQEFLERYRNAPARRP